MVEKSPHFADRLLSAVAEKNAPVCVGIDPNPSHMPAEYVLDSTDPMEQLEAVGKWAAEVLDAVAPHVPAIKPQIAYFEALQGPQPFFGMAIYAAIVRLAHNMGLLVVGDAKRNDIGTTATAYARAHLGQPDSVDALTINAYLGADGVDPFLQVGLPTGRGAFALVRTSNPSAKTIQDFADADGKPFYRHMAEQIAAIGSEPALVGTSGYSLLGAVVGATWPTEAAELREVMPQQIFLVPGYGAQGATAKDCAASFKADGTGAIVNAARSVIYAHTREEYKSLDWKTAVATAAKDFAEDIRNGLASAGKG